MSITRYPSQIVIEDASNQADIARVELVDAGGATVKIEWVTNAREWLLISAQIHAALLDMRLEGDGHGPA